MVFQSEIIAKYSQGLSIQAVSKLLGISRGKVTTTLRDAKVIRGQNRKFSSIKCASCACNMNPKSGNAKFCKTCVPDEQSGNRLRRYGLSKEKSDELLASQNYRCAICLKEKTRLVVDHCHTTGNVRGFLCYKCNTSLGCVERKDWLTKAQEYLSEHAQSTPINGLNF